jgi:eukaryotic-like serine/threonine-protein kinase
VDRLTWARIEAIGAGALERQGEARAAYIAAMCADDATLAGEVQSLLAELEADPGFLETSVLGARTPVGERANTTSDAQSGAVIGPYTVVRPLGEGGMGQVLLASRQVDGIAQMVALKMIRTDRVSADMVRRFRQERRILAGLEHPHIARFIDAGVTVDDHPYVAMEYVDGETITRYCTARALRRVERLSLFLTVCDAVQHAHQRLVVHRDLKPGNILVTADGSPKLLDFGIGKLIGEDNTSEETQAGARLLTPGYAAPEQLEGGAITTATDVYALGVLLYELLTDRHPFRQPGMADGDVARSVLRSEPTRPSVAASTGTTAPVAASELRGDLDTIVLMALRREPARRYSSAAALAEDIRRYLRGLPVAARADTLGYRLQKFARRNAAAVSGAAAIAVALVAISTVTWVQSRRVAAESARAAAERDQALEVRGFLMEMFGATGSDQTVGDTLTVRALLDKQRARLDTIYRDRPQAKAAMLEVLADGYDRLGYPADAEPLATQALALRRATTGTLAGDLAASLNLAGWIAHERGHSADAERLLLEALAIRRTEPATTSEGLSRTLNDLGVVYNAVKRYDDAVRVSHEALLLRRAEYGDAHRAVGITANNLAAAYFYQKKMPDAIATQSLALRALRAAVGNDHQRTVVALSNLAAFKRAQGDLAGAEADYRALVAQQSRLQGRAHPVTARMLSALAVVLTDRAARAASPTAADSMYTEAESLYAEALGSLADRLGSAHPQVTAIRARLDTLRAVRRRGTRSE